MKAFLGLSIGVNIILFMAAISLSRDTPDSGPVCVPIYSATGLECTEKGCR